jgi:multiple sugar transport system substrate-binding protein
MRRTPVITLASLAIVALTLSSCGREADEAGSAETGAAVASGPATGTITVWAMGAEGEKLPELTKEFEAANPGVKVEVTAIPWDAAHDKFTTAITANKTPDVAMVGTTWMGEFAGMDAIDPTPGEIDTSVFFEGAQETTEVAGTSYGIPWYVETRLVYYRTDLAEKAGITTPPTDWAGLKDMAKAMQDKAGATWGMGMQAGGTGSWQSVMPFGWSAGADLTKDDGKAYNFDSPELLKASQYYQSYFTDGIADKAAPATPTTEPDFVSGKVPMFISGPWMMSAVEAAGGGEAFKNTENRDSSWKLVQWLGDAETQVTWYGMSTALPSVKSAWQDPALTADTKLAVFGKQLETAQAPPSFPTWEQVVTSFDSEMEKVTKTGADPAAALTTVQTQAESIGTGN